MLGDLPVLAHWFGLHPPDIDRLTSAEYNAYVAWAQKQQQG